MKPRSSTWARVAVGCLFLGLAACGDKAEKAGGPTPAAPVANAATPSTGTQSRPSSPAAPGADTAAQQWDKKAQAYIQLNNRLLKFNGHVNETFAQWAAQARAKVAKGDFKAIRTDAHYFDDAFVKNIKAALDNPASMPAADAAARNLLDSTQKYVPNWKSLEEYNKAKKFEDDSGAEGKRMLPMYVEGVDKLTEALKQFSAAVDGVAKEANDKALAAYKANGKLLELYRSEALNAARAVADTFSSAKDFKDATKLESANAQLAVMENKLAEMRAEHEKRKTESPKSLPTMDRYDSIYSSLTAFAGSYREARKNPQKFNDAIGKFNDAIEASNMMSR